jgi:hypothetical protein
MFAHFLIGDLADFSAARSFGRRLWFLRHFKQSLRARVAAGVDAVTDAGIN